MMAWLAHAEVIIFVQAQERKENLKKMHKNYL
jgi:hypothetical protein